MHFESEIGMSLVMYEFVCVILLEPLGVYNLLPCSHFLCYKIFILLQFYFFGVITLNHLTYGKNGLNSCLHWIFRYAIKYVK